MAGAADERMGPTVDDEERSYRTMSIAEAIADADGVDHVPVTFDRCAHVVGPFFHGTSAVLAVGDLIGPGQPMNHDRDRIANHVYFSALLEPAVWGAELAVAHTGGGPATAPGAGVGTGGGGHAGIVGLQG